MITDEQHIRTLIERWAAAVRAGDLDGVVADHADDIVMHDVPENLHGIEAYRKAWPPFFDWLAQGVAFDVESLDVTAGADVAFAHALLRCGPVADDRGARLRITFGLRKDGGRWVVAHEHHSFPIGDQGAAEAEVRQVHERWHAGTAAKDLDGMLAAIAADVVSYEQEAPLQHVGVDAVRQVCARGLAAAGDAPVTLSNPGLKVLVREGLAVSWGLDLVRVGASGESWSRGTRVFERRGGKWVMVHQHLSVPYDPATGEARTDLRP
ncbi:nuclear transport factor 2 family protein [[Actinomadura] parvosata]|uniref:nuclear transport factor 2 family protein n=1 Tax=[Actinomadura] parvosata TaxID=1955412 RepID=UPI00406C09CB